ncbi:hypothetical protein FEM48_Zijuj03G0186100 [Ziziphus jujuba var. spinosa]|uniref:RRM domain-containing protein n=1 Tax=Ziziphus jujuba var. spinosa TaxID=714518 RepID=A0A978VRY5_ZIZJJ|nr:hypothetical protein FEM48_Zijuj03G0186100 [Ziziphus jujuba var. spinosa]
MMSQFQRQNKMIGAQFGDTTYTKVFVGGLAWETQRETMKHYFEQFGEILEAAVITDKNTGRSKGYGFVTYKDPVSAMKACYNPYPVIDGRRANCNLAAFGAPKNHPTTPQRGLGKFRPSSRTIAPVPFVHSASPYFYPHIPEYVFPHAAYGNLQYSELFPDVSAFRFPCYPQQGNFPVNYYNAYGGQQFPSYYAIGSPGISYFGGYPQSTIHAQSSPPRNPKMIETSLGSFPLTPSTSLPSITTERPATGTIASGGRSGSVSEQKLSA